MVCDKSELLVWKWNMLMVFPGDNFCKNDEGLSAVSWPSSDIPDLIEKHFSSAAATMYEGLSCSLSKRGGGTTFLTVSKMVKYLENENILRKGNGRIDIPKS